MVHAITLSHLHDQRIFILLHVLLWMTVIMSPFSSRGQSVVVNPDGSHSLVIRHNSSSALLVNPDGSHTQVFDHGNTQVRVNPDGSHTVVLHSDTDTPLIVNPDGTHTQVINACSESPLLIHPDGRQTRYIQNGDLYFQPCRLEQKTKKTPSKESRKRKEKMEF